jgi:ActR/RegA family two-component response regulator
LNKRTVLIIDDDLGFVFWLGHVLTAAAYSPLPAKSVPDAVYLVKQLGLTVDVLAINPALPGGLDFISALQRSQQDIRVIGVLNDPQQVAHIFAVNAAHLKPTVFDEMAKGEWLECIDRVITTAGSSSDRTQAAPSPTLKAIRGYRESVGRR